MDDQIDQAVRRRLDAFENTVRERIDQQAEIRDLLDVMRRGGRNKVKPPTFDGKQDIRKFLTTFDEVREVNDWNEETALLQLKLSLSGNVRETVQGATYDEIREYLVTRYEVTEDEARRELRSIKPKKGENVYDFGDYVHRITQIAHPNLERAQLEELAVKYLVDAMGDWILRREFRNQPARDFSEALQRIQEYVSDKGENSKLRRVAAGEDKEDEISKLKTDVDNLEIKLKEMETSMTNKQKDILEAIEKMSKNTTTTTTSPQRSVVRCHYCHKLGHIAKDCRKKKRDEANKTNQQSGNGQGPVA
jgi:hypothetical protein